MDLEWFHRTFENAKALIDDANALSAVGRHRRAAFLGLTAYEEVLKLKLIATEDVVSSSGKKKAPYSHKKKFAHYQSHLEAGFKSILENWVSELIARHSPDSGRSIDVPTETVKKVSSYFDPVSMREAFLYEDEDHPKWAALVRDRDTQKYMTEFFISLAMKDIPVLQDFFDDLATSFGNDWLERAKKELKGKRLLIDFKLKGRSQN